MKQIRDRRVVNVQSSWVEFYQSIISAGSCPYSSRRDDLLVWLVVIDVAPAGGTPLNARSC